MKRIGLIVVSFAVCLLSVASVCMAAAMPGSQVTTRLHNGVQETRIQTVDPAVPGSLTVPDDRIGRGHPLDDIGQMLWETSHPTGLMNNVAMSDDGSVVAIAVDLNEFQLQVYNGVTGEMVYNKAGAQWVNTVAVSGSGSSIAFASASNLYLMTATDSIPVWTAEFGAQGVGWVGMSKDGSYIVLTESQLTNDQDSLHVWGFARESSTPIWVRAVAVTPLSGFQGVSFSGDGSHVAVTARDSIYVMNPVTGAQIWTVEANNTEHPAKLSYDGHVLTTGSNGGTFRVFGWDPGQQTYLQLWRYSFTGGTSNWATASAVSGDGMTVACGSLQFTSTGYAGFVAVFDTYAGGQPLWLSPTMYDMVSDVDISDNGLTIAACSWGDYTNAANPNIMVFDKYNSTPFFQFAHPGSPNDLAINPAGTRIVAGGKAVNNRIFGNGGHAYVFAADLQGGTVSGTVTINGLTDFSGVTVEAPGEHRSAVTDATGAYHIHNIPAGTHSIMAHKLGYTSSTTAGIVVPEGGTVNNVDFTLDTVGVAPANLQASQALLTKVHLTWNPVTELGRQTRDHERRVAVGDEPPDNLRGPVAAVSGRTTARKVSPWKQARHSPLDDLDEADSIRVWRGPTQGGPYLPIATLDGAAVAYDDSFRVFPTYVYYYVVTAVYNNGESNYSGETTGRLDGNYLVYNPVVPAMTNSVTFDGVISSGEWTDAVRVDASDVFGYDAPNAPQTVFLYLKYDDSNDLLLVACEDHNQTTLDDNDGFGIYVDDDDNNAWTYSRPGTEGNYWAYYYNSGPTLRFRSLTGEPYASTPYQFANPQIGFSVASGYFSGEVAIPMGFHQPYQIGLYGPDRSPGIGFFVTNRANGGLSFDGWWPQNMPTIVSNPEYFGDCSIQATLYVPPIPPSNVTVANSGANLLVTWTDPTEGIDSMALHQPLAGVHVFRNGQSIATVEVGVQTFLDSTVANGGWYGYQTAGFILENTSTFDGTHSAEVGAYAGAVQPVIDELIQDDGTWETQYYVTYPDSNNRMAEQFDMPPEHSKVYTIRLVTTGTHSYNLGIAADDGGVPGAYIAGPYTVTPPVSGQLWTFHIPGLEQPTVSGVSSSFWVSLDWDHSSPLDPFVMADINGQLYNRSWYYTINRGWTQVPSANWAIRAGVGDAVSGIGGKDVTGVVHQFRLMSNYPNPFNPSTTIPFELAETGNASLTVYNLMGQKVTTLLSGVQQAGYHLVQWSGRDDLGQAVASGMYLMRLEAGTHVSTQKIALIR